MNCLLGQLVSHYICIFLTIFSGEKIGSHYFYLGLVGRSGSGRFNSPVSCLLHLSIKSSAK